MMPTAAGARDGVSAAEPLHAHVLSRSDMVLWVLQAAALLALGLQIAIGADRVNVASATVIVLSSTLTLQYLRIGRGFEGSPLSSFALLGLCISTQWGALIAQTVAWVPVSDGLRNPQLTFKLLGLFQAVAILAHWLVRRLAFMRAARGALSSHLLRPMGMFDAPSPGNLWIIGAVGFVGLLAGVGVGIHEERDKVGDKILDGLRFLAWAPFLIPILHRRYGDAYCNLRRQGWLLAAYIASVVVLGLALNVRSVMFAGITTVALQFVLLLLMDRSPMRLRDLWRGTAVLVPAALLIAYTADLATAMVIARSQRGLSSPVQMIESTIHALGDRAALDMLRDHAAIEGTYSVYDEYYIANPILARFVDTKFHDNMFAIVDGLAPDEIAAVREDARKRVLGTLPRPLLTQLGFDPDLKVVLEHSIGDYLNWIRYGESLGGFRIGSVFAHMLAVFGMFGPLVYLLLAMPVLLYWDSHARSGPDGRQEVSPLAMLLIVSLFLNGLSMDSVSNMVNLLIRGFAQSLILYALVFWLSRLAFRPFSSARRPADTLGATEEAGAG